MILPQQDRTHQLAGVLADVPPKFFGFHPAHARSLLVGLEAFERKQQVLAAQYHLECDLRKSGLVLCDIAHFHHGRCALLNPASHSVRTLIQAGFLCLLRHATLLLRQRTPISSVLWHVLPPLLVTHSKFYSEPSNRRSSVNPPRVKAWSFRS